MVNGRALLLALFASAFRGPTAGSSSDAAAEIRRLEQDLARAVVAIDVDAIRRIEAPTYVYTGSEGRIGGREDFIAGYRSGQTVRVLAFDDLVVDVYGDAAVVRGVQTVERVSDGLPVRRIARYTRFYVRFPGGWQAVAAHASPLPPPAAK